MFRSAHAACASGITHERQPNFRHRKKKEKENRKIERGEFITPPRPTGRRSNNGWPSLNVFEDCLFKQFQDSLDSEMQRLTSLGVGANVKEAQAFTIEQGDKLWNLNLSGNKSAKVLLDTMVFLMGKNFALRSGQK